jgi:hypothetical protein
LTLPVSTSRRSLCMGLGGLGGLDGLLLLMSQLSAFLLTLLARYIEPGRIFSKRKTER